MAFGSPFKFNGYFPNNYLSNQLGAENNISIRGMQQQTNQFYSQLRDYYYGIAGMPREENRPIKAKIEEVKRALKRASEKDLNFLF